MVKPWAKIEKATITKAVLIISSLCGNPAGRPKASASARAPRRRVLTCCCDNGQDAIDLWKREHVPKPQYWRLISEINSKSLPSYAADVSPLISVVAFCNYETGRSCKLQPSYFARDSKTKLFRGGACWHCACLRVFASLDCQERSNARCHVYRRYGHLLSNLMVVCHWLRSVVGRKS
jgi:hypothetical protein